MSIGLAGIPLAPTPTPRKDFVSNALVVIVPATSGKSPKALADLGGADYARIAIGLPASVPVGRYTQTVLEQAKLWDTIQPKMIGSANRRMNRGISGRGGAAWRPAGMASVGASSPGLLMLPSQSRRSGRSIR